MKVVPIVRQSVYIPNYYTSDTWKGHNLLMSHAAWTQSARNLRMDIVIVLEDIVFWRPHTTLAFERLIALTQFATITRNNKIERKLQ